MGKSTKTKSKGKVVPAATIEKKKQKTKHNTKKVKIESKKLSKKAIEAAIATTEQEPSPIVDQQQSISIIGVESIVKYLKENEYSETLITFEDELKQKKASKEERIVTDSGSGSSEVDNKKNEQENVKKSSKKDKKEKSKEKKSKTSKNDDTKLKNKDKDEDRKEMKAKAAVKPAEESDEDTDVSDTDCSDVSDVSTTDVSSSEDEEDSDSDSSEDSETMREHNRKKQKALKLSREAAKKAADSWTPTPTTTPTAKDKSGANTPFARVDSNLWAEHAAKDGVEDNTYSGAFGTSGFGAKSSEKLLRVRGKDFRHEKTKRKRTFNGFSRTGGSIDQGSNSIKYKYDDE